MNVTNDMFEKTHKAWKWIIPIAFQVLIWKSNMWQHVTPHNNTKKINNQSHTFNKHE
jgi:hypothetical protein